MANFTSQPTSMWNTSYQLNGNATNRNMSEMDCAMYSENCSYQYIYDIDSEIERFMTFEKYVRIIVPIIFGLIVVLGLLGNLLVIFVVLCNKQMRSTTNILIVSLAFADLLFIIFCVPFTAAGYALPFWPFGDFWCKIVQFVIFVSAYISIYTLVLMSLDRYLAVVHPVSSMAIRTQRNAYLVVAITWCIFIFCHTPLLFQYGIHEYNYYGEDRSACMNVKGLQNPGINKVFFASFLVFGYLLPLSLICVLYGFMLKRLLYGMAPVGSQRNETNRSRKRVTRMVIIIVVIFAICWLPIQIIFMLQQFGQYSSNVISAAMQMAANCLAYMNSCVNPILYAFLSDNFRKGFKKLLSCSPATYSQLRLMANGHKDAELILPTRNSLHSACVMSPNQASDRSDTANTVEAANQCGRMFRPSMETTSQCAQTDL